MIVWSCFAYNSTDSLYKPERAALVKQTRWLGSAAEASVFTLYVLALFLRRCRYGFPFRVSMGVSGFVLAAFLVLYLYFLFVLGRM